MLAIVVNVSAARDDNDTFDFDFESQERKREINKSKCDKMNAFFMILHSPFGQ